MQLTDKYIHKIEPKEKRYTITDERGLYFEIAPMEVNGVFILLG